MEFRILGSMEVWNGEGRQVEVSGSKRRAVLALLVLHANEVVSKDRLIGDLWGEDPPRNAAAALHNHISRLRKSLGPDVLATRAWGYVLRADPDSIDLDRFEVLVADAEALPARERAAKLAEALALWRGVPLEDLAFEPALAKEIARLEELRLSVIERRIDADLELGRHADVVGELEPLIAAHRLREHLRWQLILALYRSGRQAEALEVYRETRRVLAEELGLEPSPALRELERAVLRQDPALTVSPPARPQTPPEESPKRARPSVYGGVVAVLVLAAFAGIGYALLRDRDSSSATARPATAQEPQQAPKARRVPSTGPAARRKHPSVVRVEPARTPTAGSRRPTPQPAPTAPTVTRPQPTPAARAKAAAAQPKKPQAAKKAPKAPPAAPSNPAPAERVRIADTFDRESDILDPTIWYPIRDGTGWDAVQRNGRLEFTFAPDATPGGQYNQVGGHFGTRCRFAGDFDARVDFTLARWPPGNGVVTALWGFLGRTNLGAQVTRGSSAQSGETYGSWLPPVAAGVPLGDTTGTLRIARVDNVVTTYFVHKGDWQKLSSNRMPGLATIAVGASAGEGTGTAFGGQEVVVGFDNFVVEGTNPVCPPGSEPPSAQ